MARYDYRCANCGRVSEEVRPMSLSGEPGVCPDCGGRTERVFSADVYIIGETVGKGR